MRPGFRSHRLSAACATDPRLRELRVSPDAHPMQEHIPEGPTALFHRHNFFSQASTVCGGYNPSRGWSALPIRHLQSIVPAKRFYGTPRHFRRLSYRPITMGGNRTRVCGLSPRRTYHYTTTAHTICREATAQNFFTPSPADTAPAALPIQPPELYLQTRRKDIAIGPSQQPLDDGA